LSSKRSKKKVNKAGSYIYEFIKAGVGVKRVINIETVRNGLYLVFKNKPIKKTSVIEERR